jgi:DDE superfamily endonuclease
MSGAKVDLIRSLVRDSRNERRLLFSLRDDGKDPERAMSIITYESVKDKAEVFRATTSLDRDEFEKLKGPFEGAYHKKYPGKAKGFGRPEVHLAAIEDKLLFILFYFKCYPIQELLGFLFGMSQERANELVHSLSEVLVQALKEGGYVPERLPDSLKKSSLKM